MVKALFLGIIEGITEFLPISSTAHLILSSQLLKLPASDYWKFFTVFIQSGAILAVLTLYFHQIFNRKLFINLLLSFIPTAAIGLLFYKTIKNVFFESNWLIILTLISFGFIFVLVEDLIKKRKLKLRKELSELSHKEAVVVGIFQSLAIVPGVSRAGAVFLGGLLIGYRRTDVALYSFLIAVPTILAASFFDLIKTDSHLLLANWQLTLIGFVSAYLSALIVVRWFIGYLQEKDLRLFGYYRIILGLILLLFFYARTS